MCLGELLGGRGNAMGNSISKKKAKASLSTNHSPSKVKAFWNFGRVDKFKAGG